MPEASGAALSVSALFAERDARRRHDREAEELLQQRKEEELAEFRKRLDNFQLTDEIIHSGLDRIKRAFERGETELMLSSFPSSFCTDGGRAIINAGVPPINKPSKEELARRRTNPTGWRRCRPGFVRCYEFWKTQPEAGGFKFAPASSTTLAACQAMSACSSRGRRAAWKRDPNWFDRQARAATQLREDMMSATKKAKKAEVDESAEAPTAS